MDAITFSPIRVLDEHNPGKTRAVRPDEQEAIARQLSLVSKVAGFEFSQLLPVFVDQICVPVQQLRAHRRTHLGPRATHR